MAPFESLRTHVLPDLIQRKRLSRTLFIWSAGCSSGQEPYSLAMLIREHFRELDDWQISIVGTDVSAAMLDRARTGLYGQIEVNRGLPAHLLIKYFHRVGVRWELDARIRSMVRFQRQSLVGPWTNLPRTAWSTPARRLPEKIRRRTPRTGGSHQGPTSCQTCTSAAASPR